MLARGEEGQIQPHERILPILKEREAASGVKRVGSLAPGVVLLVLNAAVVVSGGVLAILEVMVAVFAEILRILAETGRGPFVSK